MTGGSRHAYYGGADGRLVPPGAVASGGRLAPPNARPVVAWAEATVCQGTRKDGQPCGARPVKGTELCVGHARAVK